MTDPKNESASPSQPSEMTDEEFDALPLSAPEAEDERVFATPSPSPSPVPSGEAAAPVPSAASLTELKRQNELLTERLRQEHAERQQQAAQAIQRWLEQQPKEKQAQYRQAIQDQMREAEDKRRVMWTIAQQNGLQGEHLQEFYEIAAGVADPYTMERLGKRYKGLQEGSVVAKPAATERPAMARTRPDAGAPEGNRAGDNRKRREEILAPFMPGGAKQGKLEEMDLVLQRHGYYG